MMFRGFPRDGARTEAPDALEVLHREQSERDVSAHDKHGADNRAPNMEIEHPLIDELASDGSANPEHPAGHGECSDHADEEDIGRLLAADLGEALPPDQTGS